MSWLVTYEGETYSSLDLTLDEVEALERISGEPWSLINPVAKIACAKAYLAVFLIRRGMADDAISKQLGALTLGDLRNAFEWIDDTAEALPPRRKGKGKGKTPDPTSAARSSPRSSGTEPSATDGHPT